MFGGGGGGEQRWPYVAPPRLSAIFILATVRCDISVVNTALIVACFARFRVRVCACVAHVGEKWPGRV